MATSPLSPSPTSSPSPGDGSNFSPSQMAGSGSGSGNGSDDGGGGDSPQEQGPSPTGGNPSPSLSQVTGKVREMETSLLSLASQFPAASGEVRRAVEGIRNVLKRIVSSPGAQEPIAPRG